MLTALQLYHLKSRDLLKQDNKGHACSTRQMLKGTLSHLSSKAEFRLG